jgi:hypothetical protein
VEDHRLTCPRVTRATDKLCAEPSRLPSLADLSFRSVAVLMLPWLLLAALILLPVALCLFADDGPRNLERDDQDDGGDDDRDLPLTV